MSVVVSDTSPLHYLVLCGAQSVLPALFQKIVIPPTVFQELRQPNTPKAVREWADALPPWVIIQAPKSTKLVLDVDRGELEAICLAQEIKAAAIIGQLLDLPEFMQRLQQTNARLNPDLVRVALERDKVRKEAQRRSSG